MATGLMSARWTHVALPIGNLDKSIDFYTKLTPLVLVERFKDDDGESTWLSNDKQVETPFVLVLVCFNKDRGGQFGPLTPFVHLGIEVPERSNVNDLAAEEKELGCLHWEPPDVGGRVGYVCAFKDPDGNVIEISHDQQVFNSVGRIWGGES